MSLPLNTTSTGANHVSQGTSSLFPVRPGAYVPKKPVIPPVPDGWTYLCGPVTEVTDCQGVPQGLKAVTKPKRVARIAYGIYGFRTVYWVAPNGDVYASLDGKVPEVYYDGDVKRTRWNHVIWGYRWTGGTARIGTGGSTPINPGTVSGGGNPDEQPSDPLPYELPPIHPPGSGGSGSTPNDPDTPDPAIVPNDGYPGGTWGYAEFSHEDPPEPEIKEKPNYLLYGAVGLGVLAATILIWRTV